MFPAIIWILVIVSAVCCAIGFYKFVWFMSVGYGIAIFGCGLASLIYSLAANGFEAGSIATYLQCILLIIYGLRLGVFLLIRELKSASYRKVLDAQTGKKVPIFVEVFMWIFMSFLYPFETSPVAYRIANEIGSSNFWQWLGVIIMAAGIVLEAVGDKQKSAAKAIDSHAPCMTGLYKYTRCPNYFGEMLVWLGVIISGIGAVQGWQWLIALIGYGAITYIMISGGFRVGRRQNKSYANIPGYMDYIRKTPILIPFIPWYFTEMPAEEKK